MKLLCGALGAIHKRLVKITSFIAILAAISVSGVAHAAKLDSVIKAEESKHKLAQSSQKKVDGLTDQRRKLYNEYKAVLKQVEDLKIYNNQVRKQIREQEAQEKKLKDSISKITETQRRIPPLMLRMVEGLEQYVSLDVPFLAEERQNRLDGLREIVGNSDIEVGEQFRKVTEAYQIESEYGTTVEAFTGKLQIDDSEREVDFLKVGRIAYLYRSLDGKNTGVWNQQDKVWQHFDGDYSNDILAGLKMARKQAPSNLMTLPVNAPEVAQ